MSKQPDLPSRVGFPPKGRFRRWLFKNCPCTNCETERKEANYE